MKQSSHVVWTRINDRACFRELQNRDDYQLKKKIASSKHLSMIYTFVLAVSTRPRRSPAPTNVAAVPLTPKFRPDSRRRSYRYAGAIRSRCDEGGMPPPSCCDTHYRIGAPGAVASKRKHITACFQFQFGWF